MSHRLHERPIEMDVYNTGTPMQRADTKVLILGSGFGGVYALRYMLPRLDKEHNIKITMVSNENLFTFSPLLHEVATGTIEPRHVAFPIRRLLRSDRFSLVKTEVESIDLKNRKVTTPVGTFDFDYLILALGSVRDMSSLENKGGYIFTLKTLSDARQIKNHLIGIFEKASMQIGFEKQKQLLTFVVSGGGYVGVQLIAAMRDFIFRDLAGCYPMVDPGCIRLILVEIEPKIIPKLHTKLGAYNMKYLRESGIEVRLKSHVTTTYSDHVVINNSEDIPTNTLIWVAGLLANPQIARLDARKDKIGRVLVNKYLQLLNFPNVYSVGDCAHFTNPSTGQPIPPKAHTGVRQAKVAAYNILADIMGKEKRPYIYSNPFEVIPLGPTKGIFSFHSLRLYDLMARFLWMMGYATLMPNMYNRVRVSADWLLSMIFGRDLNLIE